MPTSEIADFLIVGGGSAGAVLASRLSENPRFRVLLVEAGDDTPPGAVPEDIADIFPRSYGNENYRWPGLQAKGVPGTPARPFIQARVMGGGSSLMGMWAIRGLPADYDAWAEAGARGWSYADVLPYFARLERDLDLSSNIHGADGPVPIRRIPRGEWPGFVRALEHAAARRGYGFLPDMNAGDSTGFFQIPLSQDAGVRASSAHSFLTAEVRQRDNLRILARTQVRSIRFEGRTARGVEVEREGQREDLLAREVILCAGAIGSPALLLRSGVGPAAELQQAGLAPLLNLDGVGRNLQNHCFLHIGLTVARAGRQDLALRNFGIVALRASSARPEGAPGDILVAALGRVSTGTLGTRAAAVMACLYAPRSRGRVKLHSADPSTPPDVDFRLLDDKLDAERMLEGANLAAELLSDEEVAALCPEAFMLPPEPPLQKLSRLGAAAPYVELAAAGLFEGPAALRRAALRALFGAERMLDRAKRQHFFSEALVRASVAPMFHPAGTCALGAEDDSQAVVDPQCRVRGLAGLRVVDASIMPTVPRANTNIPTLMVAERAADIIRRGS